MSKRVIVWIVSLAVVAAVIAGVVWKLRTPSEPEVKYETAPAERGRLRAHVTASGTLSALVTVQVGSQVSGRIDKLHADFNAAVKKGDVIAEIEPQMFKADVQKARANLIAASGNLARTKAEAALAERQAARARELRANGISSQSDLDTAESAEISAKAQVDAQKGAVEQARAALSQAEINLAYTTIKSPIDGVVISRSVDVGQTVAASLSAPTLFTIAEDLRKMQVDTFVAEADVGKLRPTMEATFTVDAFPGRRFKGIVREIRNAPQTVQNVVTYDAVIDVDNSALELKPGMTANVTIIVAEKDDVLKVPNAALRFRPGPELVPTGSASAGSGRQRGRRGAPAAPAPAPAPASAEAGPESDAPAPDASAQPEREDRDPSGTPAWRTVWVLRGPQPQPVRVRAGMTDGTSTEIVEGELQAGDEVVVSSTGGASSGPPANPRGGSLRRMF
jgi:HlyD family secretion protein